MDCWQEKERKVSPQADSLESLMIPWLICIGHPAVSALVLSMSCILGQEGKTVGIQLKRLLRLRQTFSIQHRKDY